MESTFIQHGVQPNYILQPDYRFSHNGYGLMQLSANYAADIGLAGYSSVTFKRGDSFYPGAGPLDLALSEYDWTCIKAEETGRDGNMLYVSANYAAIDPNVSPDTTNTEATLSTSAVSEPIETHPNFSQILCKQIPSSKGTPLGGKLGPSGPPLTMEPVADNPYRAKWIIGSIPGALNYQFVGFLPQQKTGQQVNRKAGVKSFLRPSVTLKLTAYTNNQATASDTCKYTGWISGPKGFGCLVIPDAYASIADSKLKIDSTDPSLTGGANWLITGVNMEVYGGLFKIQADLLLSGPMGWDKDIYPVVAK